MNAERIMGRLFLAIINREVTHTRTRSRWTWMDVSGILGTLAIALLLVLPEEGIPDHR